MTDEKNLESSDQIGNRLPMPRSNRYIVQGHTYHLTHRCHDRSFLLKFAKDRDKYVEVLRTTIKDLHLPVLNFTVTSNHIHLLARPESPDQISQLMQMVAGEMAQSYNRRKHRSGAFWEGRFDSTMIEDGTHLWNCMKYIDLNMVRAGAVPHPEQWTWTGYRELIGLRHRYCVLDLDRIISMCGFPNFASFRSNYVAAIRESLANGELSRDPKWTESLAVGSRQYIEGIQPLIRNRRELELRPDDSLNSTWVLRESPMAYGSFLRPKIDSKAVFLHQN